ncbi:uncharacterized protein HD556DRAFT_1303507 [Suillus plorans]|uniref:Uncharacterized protein n=1 Tax=Suillus plorans TaxID=116603 RepID=A0A9P7DWN2_9AGAM|nr:uncharacterized protein HD556DRAFT_1303507 [Suillus plorans]KAG1804998.1 hypothetical protein HD556DRAFT_1303507 [Suillus plorans]
MAVAEVQQTPGPKSFYHGRSLFAASIRKKPNVALITSIAEGIGRDIALRLVEDGLDIVNTDLKSQCTKSTSRTRWRRKGGDGGEYRAGQIIVKSVVDCKPAPSLIRFYGDRHTPKATLVNFDWIFNVHVRASEIGSQGITVNAYGAPEQSIRVSDVCISIPLVG